MANVGAQWASMMQGLSEKRSSIETAAQYALDRPEMATEFFAAILARVLVSAAPARRMLAF